MSVTVTQELTQQTVTVTGNPVENNVTVTVSNARGPAGTGGGGSNSVTSATTSDGTANLSLLNVTTATAEVTGTLTASHIHGNLAGNVYGHIRAGETLEKGDPVYVSGSHGSGSTLIPIVSKADASNAAKMPAIGIMDAGVTIHNNGHMVIVGTITELDTDGLTVNSELYVAAGGGMTATPPTARAQPVARVERANLNNGAIIVKVNGLSASDATPSTLVRRTSEGTISVKGLIATGGIEFNGNDAEDSMTFNQGYYFYGTGAASAHRTALGSGATGDELFTAASASAARTTLGLGSTDSPTFATLTATKVTNTTSLTLSANTTGTDFQRIVFSAQGLTRFQIFTNSTQRIGIQNGGQIDISSPVVSTSTVTASNFKRGTGSPESVVTGVVGDIYARTDGGAGTTLYVKESGTSNTGWVAK